MRKSEKLRDWAISSQADAKAPEGSTTRRSSLKPSAEELRRMYAEMTTRQIAEKLGIGQRTATRWVHEAGIQPRRPGQRVGSDPLLDANWLRDQYVTQNKSAEQIAKEIGSWPKTVTSALRKAGIEIRKTNSGRKYPEAGQRHSDWLKGRFTGDKNPNWRGDAVKKYRRDRTSYASKEWAKKVKERDNYRCVKCGSTGPLHAHHIISWRRNAALRYEVSNGVTLCIPCHQLEHDNEFAAWILGKGKTSTSAGHPKG